MTAEIIGREEELAALHSLFEEPREGLAAALLEGEAGIGKSTLWRAGVDLAREQGMRVLSSQPAEAEQTLAHVGLGDLFEDALDDVLPALAPARRHALSVALLMERSGEIADPRTLGVASRDGLELLAGDVPIVVAIDDLQWLDPSSASALAFAVRRLSEKPILLLLARRLGGRSELTALERALPADRLRRMSVGPLSIGATHQLLLSRLGRSFPRPTLLRVHETSAGNPFYALELARAVSPDVDPTQRLRVPETLEGLVHARLGGLPEETRDAMLLAAAIGRPSVRLLAALGVIEAVLDAAHAAHVIEQDDGMIRFTHPLLASGLYQSAAPEVRRRAHQRVASVVEDPVDRARHLAQATASPDPEIATILDDAAAVASRRGAPIVEAEFSEHALRLTPAKNVDDRHRRMLACARAHLAAGEGARARGMARDVFERTAAGPTRAEAAIVLSDFENLDRGVALLQEALVDAVGRPALQSVIHCRLAGFVRLTEGRELALEHAHASLALAEAIEDEPLRVRAESTVAFLRFDYGDEDGLRLAEQAYEAASAVADPELLKEAGWALAHVLMWSLDIPRARTFLENEHRRWSERDELFSADALWFLAWVEIWAGRWPLAATYAERVCDVNRQYGVDTPQSWFLVAMAAVHRGELDRARRVAERSCALRDEQGALLAAPTATIGLVDLWSGGAAIAVSSFAAAEEMATAAGVREPAMRWWRPDYVEALLELGRIDEAVALLDSWEADAVHVSRTWVCAQIGRCRGLVSAASGDVERAQALLEDAVAEHEAVGDSFGRARALLALGVVRRRMRQKRAAREAIEAAVAVFEVLGAATWVNKARAELGRVGGRTRIDGLTPAEQRVADLAAAGRTNREVASTLFLGERTVASHLTRIYSKLGVRSRTELARKLQ